MASPFFSSPMEDLGYDLQDHTTIDSLFGDMADFDTGRAQHYLHSGSAAPAAEENGYGRASTGGQESRKARPHSPSLFPQREGKGRRGLVCGRKAKQSTHQAPEARHRTHKPPRPPQAQRRETKTAGKPKTWGDKRPPPPHSSPISTPTDRSRAAATTRAAAAASCTATPTDL
ncbi:alpha-amylase family glycosyl hydrolase [Streptomyces lydicamycinicus]|uniref:alpha-amylase family glycosyl hydrolase n=1 Tax=Streptomyces lydicamycinicus TaxID=1546107 RepID=UPI003D801BF3